MLCDYELFKLVHKVNFANILQAGLNFINVLCTAFTPADPRSVKKFSIFFTLSGSTSVKAVHKSLVKLSPGGFCADFLSSKKYKDKLELEKS